MIKKISFLVVMAALFLGACNREITDYVNPFVGTDLHGHTFPGAIVPFGMIQPSPDTRLSGWDGCSGYHYSDDTIYGFSQTHLSGTGCEDYGDILLMPVVGKMNGEDMAAKRYRSHFSHRNEVAEPGFYRVILDKDHILAELTTTERVAFHQYHFSSNGTNCVVIDLTHRDKTLACDMQFDDEKNTVTGFRHSSAWSPNQHCFFALTADHPITHVEFFKAPEGVVVDESENAYAVLYFENNVKDVEVKVAISAVDTDGALANLATAEGKKFGQVKDEAHKAWVKELSKIEVEGKHQEDLKVFYTSLYHCFTAPYLYSDADGRFRGQNDSIYTCDEGRKVYTVFSLWDTYRALHPLLTLIDRERTADFIYTFEKCYETGGELPMWELASHETHCMIGYHACPVILDAKNAGILDSFSDSTKRRLLEAMIYTSNRTEAHRSYARKGYLSSEIDNESVSKTIEYAYDDWCIHQYAYGDKLFKAEDYQDYTRRSLSWMNIMDDKGFVHARRNGGFVQPFSPAEVNNHYTEANSWQYSTYVPHHLKNYFEMLGGNEGAEKFLDSLFRGSSKMEGREQVDIDGLIGQYAHGNEPSHHAAYLYNYLGKQWKSAELVRQICTTLYSSKPDGEIGNDDCGQMAAWYVLSALGFYPVCPGSDHFAIGSPIFSKATIHLENGQDIVINCSNQSRESKYVNSLSLNGAPTKCAFVDGKTLREGCTLDFDMAVKPNTEFGSERVDEYITSVEKMDSTFSKKGVPAPAPYFNHWEQRFNDFTKLEIHTRGADDLSIYYTLDGSAPDTNSTRYTSPIVINSDVVVKAVAYSKRGVPSAVAEQQLTRFVADKILTYHTLPDQQYRDSGEEGLIDRLYGTSNYRIGGWQGWQIDAVVLIDLKESKPIHDVHVDCLSDCRAWVFFPSAIEVEWSNDGKTFNSFGKSVDLAKNMMSDTDWNYKEDARQQTFAVHGKATAQYVRVKVFNYGKLPSWHISAGSNAWLFIDEIEVR